MKGYIGLIVKATRLCNLRCAYCHDWRVGQDQTMSFTVLAGMIAAALQDPEHHVVDFIWHGGETTVLPLEFYEKALSIQARFHRPGQVVRNIIQTNGTRLTPEWARFLRANRFTVGISLDGPAEIHDRYRRYASGRVTFHDTLDGIGILKEYGIPFSVLMVIDEATIELGADYLFDFLIKNEIRDLGLNAAKPTNQPGASPSTPTTHYTDPNTMTKFLIRLFDLCLEHGDQHIHIRELAAISNRIQARRAGMCTLGGGCLGQYFLVEPSGEIAHCDLFLGDPRYSLGNIVDQDFASLRESTKLVQLIAENEEALDRMRSCSEFSVCNGWCPHERYTSLRHNPSHQDTCCGLRNLIEHVRMRLNQAKLREFAELRYVSD